MTKQEYNKQYYALKKLGIDNSPAMTLREIADELNISFQAVDATLKRAMRKFAQNWVDMGYSDMFSFKEEPIEYTIHL